MEGEHDQPKRNINCAEDAIRERLERDMAEHLAKGGKVRQVQGFSDKKVTLSFRDQNRAAWNRKMSEGDR